MSHRRRANSRAATLLPTATGPFARDWIAAQAGQDAFGAALALNPDSTQRKVEASEAFNYADAVKDARDSPNFSQLSCGRSYRPRAGLSCLVVVVHHSARNSGRATVPLSPRGVQRAAQTARAELEKLTSRIDEKSEALRTETAEKVRELVDEHFR